IRNQSDVHDAARLIGKADDPAAVKRRIIAIAKRKGFSLPESWRAGRDEESESREAQPTSWETEREVRESTVQPASVRTSITREGRGYRIKDCQLMQAGGGNSLHNNVYLPEAIEALVPEVKRSPKAYLDHSIPQEVRERGHRSLRDLAGVYD